ncbi:MAG: hypothetical protein WD049_09600, partial [Candidatus Paceibacterota bacterium]
MKTKSAFKMSRFGAVLRHRRRTVLIAVLKSVFRACCCNGLITPTPVVDGTRHRLPMMQQKAL